ncbi:unnamed protein product [Somion occarium]|uniref:Uncharacterized protein n=1 Tax=Somion occarium TaxID=3059160 RepID=A0ABP1DSD2_9APHY
MAAAVDESTPDESIIHDMRITQHGKMNAWVEFALDFLHQNPETGITLHTLPAPKRQTPTEPAVEQPPEPKDSSQAKPDRMPPSMSTIPRLISVAEIIKREYLKTLSSDDAQEGVLTGLHQYNVIGTLPDESPAGAEDPEAERLQAISAALTGKNHLYEDHS